MCNVQYIRTYILKIGATQQGVISRTWIFVYPQEKDNLQKIMGHTEQVLKHLQQISAQILQISDNTS